MKMASEFGRPFTILAAFFLACLGLALLKELWLPLPKFNSDQFKETVEGMIHDAVKSCSSSKSDAPNAMPNTAEQERLHSVPRLKVEVGQDTLNTLRQDGIAYKLANVDIDALTNQQARMTIHSYLDNTDTFCWRKLRLGEIEDGGWELCDDPSLRPVPPCIVYSFGVGTKWGFDDDISRLYGCHVYAFDPSINLEIHNRSALVHFYNWGLGGKTEFWQNKKWQMYTFQDIRKILGHTDTNIDIIKMDIESSEWPSLNNILATGQLKGVKQLLLEYHVTKENGLKRLLKPIQGIEKEGFKKFLVHKNHHCARGVGGYPVKRTSCYEVHYIRG